MTILHILKYIASALGLIGGILILLIEVRDKDTREITGPGKILIIFTIITGITAVLVQFYEFDEKSKDDTARLYAIERLLNPLKDFSFSVNVDFPTDNTIADLTSKDTYFKSYINRINKLVVNGNYQQFDFHNPLFPLKKEYSICNLLLNNQGYIKIYKNFNSVDSLKKISIRPNQKGDMDFRINIHGMKDSSDVINLDPVNTIYFLKGAFHISYTSKVKQDDVYKTGEIESTLDIPSSTIVFYFNEFLPLYQIKKRSSINKSMRDNFRPTSVTLKINGKKYDAILKLRSSKALGVEEVYIGKFSEGINL
jgi:hypothetical protein